MKQQLVLLFQLAAKMVEAAIKQDVSIFFAAFDEASPMLKDAFNDHLDDFVAAINIFDNVRNLVALRALVEAAVEFGAGHQVVQVA